MHFSYFSSLSHLFPVSLIKLIIFREEYNLQNLSVCNTRQSPATSSPLDPKIILSTMSSNIPRLCTASACGDKPCRTPKDIQRLGKQWSWHIFFHLYGEKRLLWRTTNLQCLITDRLNPSSPDANGALAAATSEICVIGLLVFRMVWY